MALQRPKVSVPSARESAQFLDSNNMFLTIKDGATELLRFLPATEGAPSIFYPVANHHGLVNQDGRKIALACLEKHGTPETGSKCLLCEVVRALYDANTEPDKKTASELRARKRFYSQVLQGLFRMQDGKLRLFGWSRPKLWQFSEETQGKLQTILNSMERAGEPLFYDMDEGQALHITREGAGFDTQYTPERSGTKAPLETLRSTWGEEFIGDVFEATGLNVGTRDMQRAYLRVSYPALDVEGLLAKEE